MKLAGLTLLVCALAGCVAVLPTAASKSEPLTREAIASARAKWKAAGIHSYDYWPECVSLGGAVRMKNYRVIVRRGKVVNARYWRTESLVLVTSSALTIDETFDELQRKVDDNLANGQPDSIDVSFHPTLGYPLTYGSRPVHFAAEDLFDYCSIKEFRTRWP